MGRMWYELDCKYLNSKCVILNAKNVYIGTTFEKLKNFDKKV